MSSTRCVLANIGLAVQNAGGVSICNQSRESLVNDDNDPIVLSKHSLKDAWNCLSRHRIADALDNNIKHPNCQDCWDEETGGRESKRIMSNRQFADVKPMAQQPKVIMIKPGNTCNLACRHCNPWTSSKWIKFYHQVELAGQGTEEEFKSKFRSYSESYSATSNTWSVLNEWAPSVVFYDLYGAEPMLIDSLWNLIENSNHSETDIHINTNGTIWNEEIQNILLKFRSVQLDISIDGINDRFEYMRFPAKWDTVEHNIDRYKELAENNSHINLHIIITVSALNIYYADETWEYFNNKKINSGFNILHQPYHLNMRILPTEIKRIISKKLIDSNTQAASLIDTLNINSENQEKNFSEFIRITSMHDEIRKESYAKVFPEMFNILDNSR